MAQFKNRYLFLSSQPNVPTLCQFSRRPMVVIINALQRFTFLTVGLLLLSGCGWISMEKWRYGGVIGYHEDQDLFPAHSRSKRLLRSYFTHAALVRLAYSGSHGEADPGIASASEQLLTDLSNLLDAYQNDRPYYESMEVTYNSHLFKFAVLATDMDTKQKLLSDYNSLISNIGSSGPLSIFSAGFAGSNLIIDAAKVGAVMALPIGAIYRDMKTLDAMDTLPNESKQDESKQDESKQAISISSTSLYCIKTALASQSDKSIAEDRRYYENNYKENWEQSCDKTGNNIGKKRSKLFNDTSLMLGFYCNLLLKDDKSALQCAGLSISQETQKGIPKEKERASWFNDENINMHQTISNKIFCRYDNDKKKETCAQNNNVSQTGFELMKKLDDDQESEQKDKDVN